MLVAVAMTCFIGVAFGGSAKQLDTIFDRIEAEAVFKGIKTANVADDLSYAELTGAIGDAKKVAISAADFKSLDSNGDDQINGKEVLDAFSDLKNKVKVRQLFATVFNALDEDGDKKVTSDEFAKYGTEDLKNSLRELHTEIDASGDKDGSISLGELVVFFDVHSQLFLVFLRVESEAKGDMNGELSAQELTAAGANLSEDDNKAIIAIDKGAGGDGNGSVSADELQNSTDATNKKLILAAIYRAIDDNPDDDGVSPQELSAHTKGKLTGLLTKLHPSIDADTSGFISEKEFVGHNWA